MTKEELKQAVLLHDVASGYVRLERRDQEWWGCCPFHEEKTASFAIKVKNGCEVFFCQGCGKGGDVVTFLELKENLDAKGAFARLRELAGDTAWKEAAKKVQETFQAVGEPEKITFPASTWAAKEKALLAQPDAMKYLLEVRGITARDGARCASRLLAVYEVQAERGRRRHPRQRLDMRTANRRRQSSSRQDALYLEETLCPDCAHESEGAFQR